MAANNLQPNGTYSPYLTDIAQRLPQQKYGALEMAPPVVRTIARGTYTVFGKEHLRADGVPVAIGAPAPVALSSRTTASYQCELFKKAHPVYLDAVNMAAGDDLVTLREQAAFVVRESMLLDREKEVATLAATAGTYDGNTHAASVKWDQSTTSVMADIGTAIAAIHSKTGMEANTIFIPYPVAIKMATQDPFKGMLLYNNVDPANPSGIGRFMPQFGLRLVLLGATYDAAGLGGSAVTYTDVWSDNVIVASINNNWFNRGTTFLSTFTQSIAAADGNDVVIREFTEERTNTLWIEGTEWRDVKVIDGHAGYLITDCLT